MSSSLTVPAPSIVKDDAVEAVVHSDGEASESSSGSSPSQEVEEEAETATANGEDGSKKKTKRGVKREKKQRMTTKRLYPLVKVQKRSPYQFFIKEIAQENRDKEGAPPLTPADYSKAWRECKDRSKWEKLSADDEERFIAEVKAHGYEIKDRNAKRQKSDKPVPPFLMYARDHVKTTQEEKQMSYREALTFLGSLWREGIDADVKQRYVDAAKREKDAYDLKKKQEQESAVSQAATA